MDLLDDLRSIFEDVMKNVDINGDDLENGGDIRNGVIIGDDIRNGGIIGDDLENVDINGDDLENGNDIRNGVIIGDDIRTGVIIGDDSDNTTDKKKLIVEQHLIEKNVVIDRDVYEPYKNRNIRFPLTYRDALFHMLKSSIGTGILAVPHSFIYAGYLGGFLGTIVIGAFSTFCVHLLVTAQYELCKRSKLPSLTYPQIAEVALQEGPKKFRWLAPYGQLTAFLLLIVDEIGALCIYLIFMTSNMREVYTLYFIDTNDIRIDMMFLFLPILLICWVPNLKLLVPFSAMATLITFLSFGVTFYYTLSDVSIVQSLYALDTVAPVDDWPIYFGIVMFSLSNIGATMPVENEMKNPKQFNKKLGVLNMSSFITTIVYSIFGFLGYMKYGNNVKGSITLNLPHTELLASSVKLMMSISVFCTFAIPHRIICDIVFDKFLKLKILKKKNSNYNKMMLWEYCFRTIIVFITFLFAMIIPNLELFIALIGALCCGFMSMGLPALVDLLTFWDSRKGSSKVILLIKDLTILLICFVVTLSGVSASCKEILRRVFYEDFT